jgi:hypothetical protein
VGDDAEVAEAGRNLRTRTLDTMKESITGKNSRLIMEVHGTHTYIGKGLELVYRNTTNQGVPCPLHKKPSGGAAEQAKHTTNLKGLMGLYIGSLTQIN